MSARSLLFPLTLLYMCVTAIRNFCYDSRILKNTRVTPRVISVGNLTVGGNGKTPFTIFLVNYLIKKRIKPAVLSRGYGGSVKKTLQVTDAHNSLLVGDEPKLIAENCNIPVIVSPDRIAGAQYIEFHKLADVIILDDGLQHRRLARDLDILLIDISNPNWFADYSDATQLPAGDFRESISSVGKRIHAVVLANRSLVAVDWNKVKAEFKKLTALSDIPVYTTQVIAEGVFAIANKKAPLELQEVFIFSAIANPAAFIKSIKKLGYRVCGVQTFRDHHRFTKQDVETLRHSAKGLPLICTEKDAIKIERFNPQNIYFLKIGMQSDFKIDDFISLRP